MRLLAIDKRLKDFEIAIEHLHTELSSVRTGRANPALVEGVVVESYGTRQPLKNLSTISVSDARTLIIQPWDKSILSDVEKGIQASNVGIQPVNDGVKLRLVLPPLNEERRVELVKLIKQMAESARIRMRNIREEIWKEIGKQQKDKQITEDQKYQAEKDLKELLEGYNEKIKVIIEKKEREILTV
ncbi:MAG: ribosome recycling factor [Candidatus Doudnabacteria bacterium RIFCSPHIGHO2_01_FULL_50_11]|uniref:Ribosome-recycling factor n=1 Tax=Candidatus Doudnabacteria bacterium RIFCSPHIGHO2_01_FULL_50_11 TaxID=1817828 RepID=A0A1F5PMR4_9BACT|nr:MAG: ribosome recycling factor [Candidatus Doudnabacteria bacterium RIFCSPHIGHO2_01_FULL_50_11]HLC44468.1 ribosome recycling factor [Patescibacteria group bacterium]